MKKSIGKSITLHNADCLTVLKSMEDNSVDALVTDPPAGINFMNKDFDKNRGGRDKWILWLEEIMKEVYRVMKPGAHGLVWSIPRTSHWTAMALENAGFEIRDKIDHIFGCLSEDTEVYTKEKGWIKFDKYVNDYQVLSFNPSNFDYEYHKPEKTFFYKNKYPAYRIQSDYTDQIVSRNHRCIIERDGELLFEYAENLSQKFKTSIPFLENLPDMPEDTSGIYKRTSYKEQGVFKGMFKHSNQSKEKGGWSKTKSYLQIVWEIFCSKKRWHKEEGKILFKRMLWKGKIKRSGNQSEDEKNRSFGEIGLDRRINEILPEKDVGRKQSGMERWCNIFQEKGKLYWSEICEMSERIFGYGKERWLCYGTSYTGSSGIREMFKENGSSSSYRSQSVKQLIGKLNSLFFKHRTQNSRGEEWRKYKTCLATVEEIQYDGNVWCVQVPTGAFVARRNGKIFITGNSGFPKNHSAVSKNVNGYEGWGTALKPAHEDWILIRKPISEKTMIENVERWGTGVINIDATRVSGGRFPANLVLSHEPECKMIGSEKTKGKEGGYTYSGNEYNVEGFVKTCKPQAPSNYGGEDVEIWECVDGCAVKMLDEQSKDVSRFFYCSKPSPSEKKNGIENEPTKNVKDGRKSKIDNPYQRGETQRQNTHPTVKAVTLMKYLITMITPSDGVVMDCFMGSGSTGIAAKLLGRKFIGMEMEEEYYNIACKRIKNFKEK